MLGGGVSALGPPVTASACNESKNSQWATGASLDLQRWAHDNSTCGGQQVEIRHTLQAVFSGAMHKIVAGQGRIKAHRNSGVGPDALSTEPQNVSFFNHLVHALIVWARVMRCVIDDVGVVVGARDLAPVRSHEYPTSRGYLAMLVLPSH